MFKNVSNLKKSILKFASSVFCICITKMQNVLASSGDSSVTGLIDDGFILIEAIPFAGAVFCFIQGGTAYSESKMEGGSAQASGKAYGFFAGGVILAIVVLVLEFRMKGRITGFFTG